MTPSQVMGLPDDQLIIIVTEGDPVLATAYDIRETVYRHALLNGPIPLALPKAQAMLATPRIELDQRLLKTVAA